jgi:hypothetical protein
METLKSQVPTLSGDICTQLIDHESENIRLSQISINVGETPEKYSAAALNYQKMSASPSPSNKTLSGRGIELLKWQNMKIN